MTEKVKLISNPLTIIAIFAALAEINATVSIGLVDKELQGTFIWFVILFPTLLIILFFLTLNFNTKVIYAPSDYKNDDSFHKILRGYEEPDKEITVDKDIIKKTLDELGIKKTVDFNPKKDFNISENVSFLFSIRYNIEKQIRNLAEKHLGIDSPKPVIALLSKLVEIEIITPSQQKAIRNIYSITSPAIHGDENKLTLAEVDFVKKIGPTILDELKEIN
ncbi:MAG: hypothetical protein ACOVOQ_15800 [Flavobacterium sp.]